jgi:hypothetical protein
MPSRRTHGLTPSISATGKERKINVVTNSTVYWQQYLICLCRITEEWKDNTNEKFWRHECTRQNTRCVSESGDFATLSFSGSATHWSGCNYRHFSANTIQNSFIYTLCSYVLKLNKWNHLLFMTFWHVYVLGPAYFVWLWKSREPSVTLTSHRGHWHP